MNDINEVERQITALENEVKHALFPVTRDNRSAENWLNILLGVKRLKDTGSPAWQRMRNWD